MKIRCNVCGGIPLRDQDIGTICEWCLDGTVTEETA